MSCRLLVMGFSVLTRLFLVLQCYRKEIKSSFLIAINNFVFSLSRVSFFGFGPKGYQFSLS